MEKIPLLDLKAQHNQIRKEIDDAIKRTLDKTDFILGEEVRLFEEEAAKYCNIKYAIGVANGTDAILLSLKALGIGQGDKVITTSFTYFATAGAIVRSGATPIFVDIDSKTYNIAPEAIERCLKKDETVKAVVPVDLYGQLADMQAIRDIAARYDLKIVEDAAQAFGAAQNARKAGTLGDCGTFSFYPGKNLGADGDGGMILTDNEEIARRLKILRNQGNDRR
jgi:dTDP-4-amino-4,6-dideoxygalactose transaminase